MNALRWLARHLYPIVVVVWANGLILRLSLRDSVELLAPLYYATPWPVLAALSFPFLWKFRLKPKAVFAIIVMIHAFVGAWILEGWRTGDPSKAPADVRVVHWNVSRPDWGFPAITEALRGYNADIIAVAEPLPRRENGGLEAAKARWIAAFPGYAASFSDGNLLLLVRGEIVSSEVRDLGPDSTATFHVVRVKDRDLNLVQVDLVAKPMRSRREPLARLTEALATLPVRPSIALGDFNTPRDSVHFDAIRKSWQNVFEKAGFGSPETWPIPFPVLSLDQVWCAHGLTPVRCDHGYNIRSDHRPVFAELSYVQTNTPADEE